MASSGVVKGKAISMDTLFPVEETAKAVRRVEQAVSERRCDLDRLHRYAGDNSDLTSLVRRLPHEVSHDIMVPFGGVAFFPGRLIHTNEFLVLLGEGYYAERSSKQTVDILQRRGKNIDAQIKSLNTSILDLEAEAKYFFSTATEAAEGLVDIREEYIEDIQQGATASKSHGDEIENREYDGVSALLDKLLEKEELEDASDESASDSDEVEPPFTSGDEGEEEDTIHKEDGAYRAYIDLSKPVKELRRRINDSGSAPLASIESTSQKKPTKAVSFNIPDQQAGSKDAISRSQSFQDNVQESKTSHKPIIGSIVERPQVQPPKITSDKTSSSNSSRPVSRFKLQKGGH